MYMCISNGSIHVTVALCYVLVKTYVYFSEEGVGLAGWRVTVLGDNIKMIRRRGKISKQKGYLP